ncbi:hypothetical protein EV401DRAFT_902525 [Pisolithus croceorrhizus]|nr:hypothetical protein EV401DRAFT_902525 [Pisolithus croceorrhizus]
MAKTPRLDAFVVSSSDVQHLFLQAVFSRGILSYSHALGLWKKFVDAVKDVRASDRREERDAFVHKIDDAFNPLDVEFLHLKGRPPASSCERELLFFQPSFGYNLQNVPEATHDLDAPEGRGPVQHARG